MKKIIVLALSLAVSSLGFSAAPSVKSAVECDDVNGTYEICETFSALESKSNDFAALLAQAGANDAAMWSVSLLESGMWAYKAATENYRDQVEEAVEAVKDRFKKAKSFSKDARSKNDNIQTSYLKYRTAAREFVFAVYDWLDDSDDDDADDFDDTDDQDDDNDDFDDDNESEDDIDDLDDADDFDDDNESDDFDDI